MPIACGRYGLKHNNNPIELHNEDIKQRYKTTGHFKSATSADAFLKLRRVYNFVRGHRKSQRRTPAEMAGLRFVSERKAPRPDTTLHRHVRIAGTTTAPSRLASARSKPWRRKSRGVVHGKSRKGNFTYQSLLSGKNGPKTCL